MIVPVILALVALFVAVWFGRKAYETHKRTRVLPKVDTFFAVVGALFAIVIILDLATR